MGLVGMDKGSGAITAQMEVFIACALFRRWNTGISVLNPAEDMMNGCVLAVVCVCDMHRSAQRAKELYGIIASEIILNWHTQMRAVSKT
jgi:hypothetical protein